MSGASQAQRAARQAMQPDGSELVDLGSCKVRNAQNESNTLYALLADMVVRLEGIDEDDELQQYYHRPTGAVVTLPPGVDVDDVLDADN